MAATSWSMVIATRSGLAGDISLGRCAAAAENGEGNGVTCVSVESAAARPGAGVWGRVAGGAGGSSAGAAAVAMLADDALPPSTRFQSEGGGETFQMFAGDSSSTPT